MATIEIYTSAACFYCDRAKALLKQKNADFQEIRVDTDADQLRVMLERSNGQRTVPQIFINDQHVGGSDDLYALDKSGKLDELLA